MNHDINQINLNEFKLRDVQLNKLNNLFKKSKGSIVEITLKNSTSTYEDYYDISITCETKDKKYNRYLIPSEPFFDQQEVKKLFKEDRTYFYPIDVEVSDVFNDSCIFMRKDLFDSLQESEAIVNKFILDFNEYMKSSFSQRKEKYKELKSIWESLNNRQRVYIYSKIDKKEYIRYDRLMSRYKLKLNYPFLLKGKWLGYEVCLDMVMSVGEDRFILKYYPSTEEDLDFDLTSEDMFEWNAAITSFLDDLTTKVPEVDTFGCIDPYISNYTAVKCINSNINVKDKNPYEIFLKVKEVLKDILVY